MRVNAQNFYDLQVRLIRTPGIETPGEIFAKLEDAYQYDSSLQLTDAQRKALLDRLGVTRAFVEGISVIHSRIKQGYGMGLSEDFAAANERWCQNALRGGQAPFTYMGGVVPYVDIKPT